MLKIRLQRFGKKKAPIYRIAVIEHSQKRDGKPVEVLGTYNPKSKELIYNIERAKYWRGVGAQASETVKFLLSKDPLHDLAQGPYRYKSKTRAEKEKSQEEILKQSTKNTKAKKKKLGKDSSPEEKPNEEAATAEAA